MGSSLLDTSRYSLVAQFIAGDTMVEGANAEGGRRHADGSSILNLLMQQCQEQEIQYNDKKIKSHGARGSKIDSVLSIDGNKLHLHGDRA